MECGEVVAESSSVGGVGASSEWRVLASTLPSSDSGVHWGCDDVVELLVVVCVPWRVE